jgi:hypothetical protein
MSCHTNHLQDVVHYDTINSPALLHEHGFANVAATIEAPHHIRMSTKMLDSEL